MKALTVIKIAIWCVVFSFLITRGLDMISAPNTIENVIGFFMMVVVIYLSIKTKCLTAIKIKKNEK